MENIIKELEQKAMACSMSNKESRARKGAYVDAIVMMEEALIKADVISRFGECKYSCQLTHEPSWFHTILIKDFSIYIEEWIIDEDEEICATVFTGEKKNANGFANTNLVLLLNDIEKFVKNGL